MRQSAFHHARRRWPVLGVALGALLVAACSETPKVPGVPPADEEVGRPLSSVRSGAPLRSADVRERPQAEQARRALSAGRGVARSGGVAPVSATAAELGEQPVSLNFVDTEVEAVVRALSRATGRQFLVDPRVKGKLTLVSEGQVPARTAYRMLTSALRMQGFSVVDVDGVSQVVPEADAKLLGGPVYGADRPAANGMVTRTFRLRYENAVNLIPVLRPIVAQNNPINAYPGNNTVVVTDYAENLDRVAGIIASIDIPSASDTDVVPIQNGIAVDIASTVSELLDSQGSGGAEQGQKTVVLADPRSNSIVIRSPSPERTQLARDLIGKLDSVQSNPGNLHVVYLRNAQATRLAQALRGLITGDSGGEGNEGDQQRARLSGGGMLGGGNSGTGSQGLGSSGNTTGSGSSGLGGSNRRGGAYGAMGSGQGGAGPGAMGEENSAFSAGGVTVQADATTNTLLISAPEPLYRNLREVIDLLDQRRAQVVIESLIVEVSEDDSSEFGIQWQAGNLGGNGVFGGVNFGQSALNTAGKNTIDVLPKGLNIGLVDGTVDIPGIGKILDLKVLARALKSRGGTNVLSTPNLLTLDNESASIMVGQTIPFVSGQYVTDGGGTSNNPFQTIQREDVGLKLNIRPQISEGGTVKLDVYQEVSSVDERASTAAGVVTNKRAIDTSILLDDGQIMVLGGLLQDNVQDNTDGVPGLSSLPGVGSLFRYQKRSRTKTNLMVFLRPYIVRDAAAGRSITLNRYDFIRRAQQRVQPRHDWSVGDMQAPVLPPTQQGIPQAAYDLRPSPRPLRAVPLGEAAPL
ncbi:TPA: type II secretion system secretin GspD [Pseudomonas aeruginosa]|nr:type II secretion system secretin GspD [Pseudomonas aeruginosa]HCF7733391.1 type II secretion system secretin GspD [Pseudomonas aeruginosa]